MTRWGAGVMHTHGNTTRLPFMSERHDAHMAGGAKICKERRKLIGKEGGTGGEKKTSRPKEIFHIPHIAELINLNLRNLNYLRKFVTVFSSGVNPVKEKVLNRLTDL